MHTHRDENDEEVAATVRREDRKSPDIKKKEGHCSRESLLRKFKGRFVFCFAVFVAVGVLLLLLWMWQQLKFLRYHPQA